VYAEHKLNIKHDVDILNQYQLFYNGVHNLVNTLTTHKYHLFMIMNRD